MHSFRISIIYCKSVVRRSTESKCIGAVPRVWVKYCSSQSANKNPAPGRTVDEDEIRNFGNLADKWWDEDGEFKALHSLNKLRVPFVRDGLVNSGQVDPKKAGSGKPLEGLKVLDVGCGGGILSEPLARLGAQVVGLDASPESIAIADLHAEKMVHRPRYVCETIEDHSENNCQHYDAVVLSEVIEHIQNKDICLQLCTGMLQPGGSIFMTTLNRTWLSQLGIFGSEYVLRLLPPRTHQHEKFISPQELQTMLQKYGCSTKLIHGMMYNFLNNKWSWSKSTGINYALQAVKQKQDVC
ncbi:ubiquinone biosynthesis O-methyltransferase, mitochondrial isoform X2 [Ischnura elegans]|uniref:ubiquinone biosynthesis O-methyltransferase, mitochondrial isoform X2 n=1 Tax=Ischnura elegans TaxID=197161 RepID=UPI001ED8ACEF|nr:ubiquinone biosynthesis O-methyltransferase, mitochondrial isoform X2 [Ischnura elegans]XP_046399544.1 ubiquinone biosynthesis O-methyltransferase, mitochondrial isoform X2 [Ischnura elegans]